ncbi:MAG: hypothetical protein US22_C0001G0022 [candidate division TM6 bacterium GW2011_GWF2_36_6]|nr:MAG: hypothetical protein US22_C0001G0022 [candidate division TM6 bacterium GW2011_GWF2_36_6]
MIIKRIGLSWVGVNDVQLAKTFFTQVLGLKVFNEQLEFGWVELCGEQKGQILGIGLANNPDEMKAGVNAIVTFIVDNYDMAKKELLDKGVLCFGEISGMPQVPRMIYFKDPDGNTYQLVEETIGITDAINENL